MNMASPQARGGRLDHSNGMGSRYQQSHNYTATQTNQHGTPHNGNVSNTYHQPGTYHQGQTPRVLQRPQGGFDQTSQVPRGGGPHHYSRPPYAQNGYQAQPRIDPAAQVQFMENLVTLELPKVEMTANEISKHDTFRRSLEVIMKNALHRDNSSREVIDELVDISLVAFGSLGSGFGLPGSDMDLAVVPQWRDSTTPDDTEISRDIPRLFEKAVLDENMGGRLLTRTRVPILKVCERPTDALYSALCKERHKWNQLPESEQYPSSSPSQEPSDIAPKPVVQSHTTLSEQSEDNVPPEVTTKLDETAQAPIIPEQTASANLDAGTKTAPTLPVAETSVAAAQSVQDKEPGARKEKQWHREKVLGPLDFPKTGVGIQCDINFANPLGIHNTHMLHCYSLTDPRVRPMVLFVKSWAKRRKINSSYSGTLSSYGWVLMVLHYLVNVASPPVCPNLQHYIPQGASMDALTQRFKDAKKISGYDVRFWSDEEEIIRAAQEGRLTQNRQPLASLLCGFFRYFASQGRHYGRQTNFYWTTEVLSLRTPGGILTKQDKGWVSATTIVTAEKKVTNRYLFAIEDPFEIDHNVARTVTHRGIVAG